MNDQPSPNSPSLQSAASLESQPMSHLDTRLATRGARLIGLELSRKGQRGALFMAFLRSKTRVTPKRGVRDRSNERSGGHRD